MVAKNPRSLVAAFLIALLALTIYLRGIENGYVFDDFQLALDDAARWQWPRDGLAVFFSPRYFELVPELSYRPVPTLSYHFDFLVLNGGRQRGRAAVHHLVNALFHAGNAALVLLLLSRIGFSRPVPFGAALIFAVHPAASEAVNGIAFREDLMVLFFSLAALLARSAALEAWRRCMTRGVRAFVLWNVIMFLAAAMALLSKETALMLPVAALLCDGLGGRDEATRRPRRLTLVLLALASALFLGLRFGPMQRRIEGELGLWSGDRWNTLIGTCHILVQYVRLLFVPVGLSLHHMPPKGQDLTMFWKFGGVVFVVGSLSLGILWWRRRRAGAFAVFWFAIWTLPVCHLVPIANAMAERFLYAAIVAPAVLLASPLDWLDGRRRRAFAAGLVVLAAAFAALTMHRVKDWRSDRRLSVATLRWSPLSARTMGNLGETYRGLAGPAGREAAERLAEQEYRRAAAADPADHNAHFNLGHLHVLRGDAARLRGRREEAALEYGRAKLWLQNALALLLVGPHYPWTAGRYHHELGIAYWNLHERRKALVHFRAAVRKDPSNDPARADLKKVLDYMKKRATSEGGSATPISDT